MDTTFGKKKLSRKLFLLMLLTFSSLFSHAGATDKFKNLISKQFNSFEGIYIMGGIIAGSLLVYVISNYLMKEKEDKNPNPAAHHHSHHRHHRHHHRVVKKTS
jgi:hypothetical protein